MVWVRTTRITLLVALLLAVSVLAYLAAHPQLYAGHIGRLVTRNLLRDTGARFGCRDFRGNPLREMVFYDVSITRQGDDGSFSYLTADSLWVSYDISNLLHRDWRLENLGLSHGQLLLRKGSDSANGAIDEATSGATDGGARRRRKPVRFPLRVAFAVGEAEIDDLSVSVLAADGSSLEEIEGIQWSGSIEPGVEGLFVKTHSLRGHWPSRRLNLHALSAEIEAAGPRLRVHDARVVLESTAAELDLAIDFADTGGIAHLTLDGHAARFSLRELFRILDKSPGPDLLLADGGAHVEQNGDTLKLEGYGHGSLDGAPLRADVFEGSIRHDVLRFDRVEGSYRGAEGSVTGELRILEDRLRLEGPFRGGDLQRPWTGADLGWPRSDLAGRFALDLVLRTPVRADVRLYEAEGRLLDVPVEHLRTHVRYEEGVGVEIDEARGSIFGTRLSGKGRIDNQDRLEMLVQAEADSLASWSRWLELPVEGRGLAAAGRLFGPARQPALRVGGTLQELWTQGVRSEENQIVVEMDRFDRFDRLRAELTSPDFRLHGRVLGGLELALHRDAPVTTLDRVVISSSDSTLTAKGRLRELGNGLVQLDLDSLEVALVDEQWRLGQPTTIEIGADRFSTPGLQISSDTGRFRVEGRAQRSGDVDLGIEVSDGDLSMLHRAGLVPWALSGLVTGKLSLQRSLDDPELDLDLRLRDGAVEGRQVDQLALEMGASGSVLRCRRFELASPYGRVQTEGSLDLSRANWLRNLLEHPEELPGLWRSTRLDLDVHSQDVHPAYWQDPGGEAAALGRVSGRFSLAGPTSGPSVEGDLSVDHLQTGGVVVPRIETHLRNDEDGVHLSRGRLLAPDPWLHFEGLLPLHLSVTEVPHWESERGVEFSLDSDGFVDLRPAQLIWPHFTRLSGEAEIHYRARGAYAHPVLSGSMRVRKGRALYQGSSEELRELVMEGVFRQDRLIVSRLESKEGAKGRITGHGEVIFKGLVPDDIWLDFDAERVLLATVPHLRAVGSSHDLQLRLVRPAPDMPRVPKITGSVLVDKAIYTGEFTEGQEADAAITATFNPIWMADLHVRMEDQVRISNANLELRVVGDIDFVRDTAGLRMRGVVEIPQGRVPLFNNDFTLTSGTLDFSRRPLEPEVDILAETEVPISDQDLSLGRELERITVHLTGTFAEPRVDFESESGLDDNSIIRLLAGFTGSEDTRLSVGVGDVGLRAGLNFLERALAQRIRGVDTIDIQTEEAGLAQMGNTRIAVGKYLSNSLYLRFGQGLSVTERDLFLEYQMTRRTLFTSELKRRLRENGAENQFNLDLKFRVKY